MKNSIAVSEAQDIGHGSKFVQVSPPLLYGPAGIEGLTSLPPLAEILFWDTVGGEIESCVSGCARSRWPLSDGTAAELDWLLLCTTM